MTLIPSRLGVSCPARTMTDPTSSKQPDRIGPYQILRVIGEGGMGVVYEAQQETPVRRRVALKMMKVGADSEQVLRRFEAEKQALAVMAHPGIAKVFDAGVTESGRSYFVMELVEGQPIHEFLDERLLSVRHRVELFIDVCEAVHHAHQKGVIHRDLKPGNVLVSDVDGKPRPKVIDFGIAKATGLGDFDGVQVTQSDQMVGTPAYMSPEQIEGSRDVDTRSDVYALGVLLYHVLLGELPYEPQAYASWVAIARQLDDEAPTFARRFSELASTQETLARLRNTTPQALRRELSGDLQWIVRKAMDNERALRYESASGLAADLARYLKDEPVVARPPTSVYRFRKFVRRNRAWASAGAVAVVALVLGAGAAMVGMLRAQASERIAQREAETAAQVSDFLVGLFEFSDPNEALGDTITVREVLDSGAESIRSDLADQPAVQARLMRTLGSAYRGLGQYELAEELLSDALELTGREFGRDDPEALATLEILGRTYLHQGRYEEAERAYLESLAGRVDELGPDDPVVGGLLYRLGEVYLILARYTEADSLLAEAQDIRARAFGPDDSRVAAVAEARATSARDQGDNEAAITLYRDALRIWEREYGPDHPSVASALHDLGSTYRMEGDYEEAEALLTRALEIRERIFGPSHPRVATTLNSLASVFSREGRFAEAERMLLRSITIKEEVYEGDHPDLANTINNLGILYARQADFSRAEPMMLRALEMDGRIFGSEHRQVANGRFNLGSVYRNMGRYADAEAAYNAALRSLEASLGPDHPAIVQILENYSGLLQDIGRVGEADAMRSRAEAMRTRLGL